MNRALLPLFAACLASPVLGQLTPQHVMRLKHVRSVMPSPDGEWLAYTVLSQRGSAEPSGGGRLEAYVMPVSGGEARPLPSASGLAWEPRTNHISYVRAGANGRPQVWRYRVKDDKSEQVTSFEMAMTSFLWRPDGQGMAFSVRDALTDEQRENQARGFTQIVVDEDSRNQSLWVMALGEAPRRLTKSGSVFDYEWAPDGQSLAAAIAPANRTDESYMFKRIHIVDVQSGSVRKLVDNPGKLGQLAWSPDGRRLAYISSADRNDPHAGSLFVVDRKGIAPVPLSAGFKGMVHHVEWIDETSIAALCSVGVNTVLKRVPARPGLFARAPSEALPATTSFSFVGGSEAVAFVASTSAHPGEVFLADGVRVRRLTDTNRTELTDVKLGEQQVVKVPTRDGLAIEGIRMLPVGYEAGKRYPLVIVAHGGPEAHYSNAWLTRYSEPGQVLAGRGYVVWYPNYRSSTGYGVQFAKHDHGDPMGREFLDHLDAIRSFKEEGLVDAERVGVIGGSYGGYTAAWAATRHSEHFAAAVSFVPFVDIRTKWLTSDIPYEFYYVHYQEQWPHEQPGFLADRSPLTYADQCRTPLLLCGGTADPRVHPSQPFMLYRAVKYATTTPVRYVQYPGEGHGNRTSAFRYDYMLRGLRWLEHYLSADREAEMPPKELSYPKW